MHSNSQSSPMQNAAMPLIDFGKLQERYQSVNLSERARLVLEDAKAPLGTAEDILHKLMDSNPVKLSFAKLRKNTMLMGKMRPSGARDLMLDSSSDFIAGTLHKLAAWRRTMERLCTGEDIITIAGQERVAPNSALALALAGNSSVSIYLSIIQLALSELVRNDKKHAAAYRGYIAEIRRCATLLSDCENASNIASVA